MDIDKDRICYLSLNMPMVDTHYIRRCSWSGMQDLKIEHCFYISQVEEVCYEYTNFIG